jgi:hypothetical protein
VPDAGPEMPAAAAVPADAAGAAAGPAAVLFKAVLVCVVVALLLALIVSLVAAVRRRRAERGTAAPPAPAADAAAAPVHALADADRLAADGRYGEAVHVLLLVAIAALAGRAARPPAASQTSRELLRLLPLDAATRPTFAALVALVEATLFGGRAAGDGEFQTARRDALTLLARGGGAAGRAAAVAAPAAGAPA